LSRAALSTPRIVHIRTADKYSGTRLRLDERGEIRLPTFAVRFHL
jgi:hypothetical protein